MKSKNGIYFPNLNGLRSIAATVVVLAHFNQIGDIFQINNNIKFPFILLPAQLGVKLFFVLSGFLITRLLLIEKDEMGTIEIKKFYLRRVMRIWPLYIILVLAGFFVFPYIGVSFLSKNQFDFNIFLLYFFFLANLAIYGYNSIVPGIAPLWSVSLEEQFYVFWPIFFKIKKGILQIMIALAILPLLIDILSHYNLVNFYSFNKYLHVFRFDSMATGGVFAYIVQTDDQRFLKKIYNKTFQIVSLVILLLLFFKDYHMSIFTNTIFNVLFAIVITNCASNKNNIVNLEYKVLNFLGKISYGIYMYHSAMFFILMHLMRKYVGLESLSNNWIYALCIIIAYLLIVAVAYVSYTFVEKKFINYKDKFSIIKSTNNAE